MGDKVTGAMLQVGFSWDGVSAAKMTGLELQPLSIPASLPTARAASTDASILIGGAAVGVLTGLASRAFKHAKTLPRDLALDAFVGAEIGTCFMSGPRPEAVCLGALSAAPMQLFNRPSARGKAWDFRPGLIVQGALSLGRAELGGNPAPFAGFRTEGDARPKLVVGELAVNGLIDVTLDSAAFALGNMASSWVQGQEFSWSPMQVGAVYGAAFSLSKNIALGMPIRLSAQQKNDIVANNLSHGGPDIRPLLKYTSFRAGGVFSALAEKSITIGSNVSMRTLHLNPEVFGHEMVHRSQIAAPGTGLGSLGFYGSYIGHSFSGYRANPYEKEAFRIGNP